MPRMEVPQSGVKVRMYRLGHGDCFLLAFRDDNGAPFYLLIDCGYKLKSEVHHDIKDVVRDIGESTGDHLHAVLITHEHQDHVNGFWSSAFGRANERFKDISVDRLWLAWTEDPTDEVANELRHSYRDTLIGLMAAQEHLAAATQPEMREVSRRVNDLLDFELEDDTNDDDARADLSRADRVGFLAATIQGITNKRAIKYIKDKTGCCPVYLRPDHSDPYWFPNVAGVSVYALGPPRNEDLLLSADPIGAEGYARGLTMGNGAESFLSASVWNSPNPALSAVKSGTDEGQQPFSPRYSIPEDKTQLSAAAEFFDRYRTAERWKNIDYDWLRSAEPLALRLNNQVNNTSLAVAIELPNTKKVLLFVGDAQRGNWISWDDQKWTGRDGGVVSARDLLGRTVLYKVGHHGSHNATLKGYAGSDYPNLNWMARDDFRDDFVAMIPANRPWAYEEANWSHPLRSIEQALERKANGRVLRIDVDHVAKPSHVAPSDWQEFTGCLTETDLYFEYWISD